MGNLRNYRLIAEATFNMFYKNAYFHRPTKFTAQIENFFEEPKVLGILLCCVMLFSRYSAAVRFAFIFI